MVALQKLDLNLLELEEPGQSLEPRSVDIKLVTFLRAHGLSVPEIALKTSLTEGRVTAILSSEKVTEDIFKVQRTLNYSPAERIQSVVNLALETKVRILAHSNDEKLKNLVATDLLDRGMGKAVQTILSQNMNFNASSVDQVDDNLEQLSKRLALLETQRDKLRAKGSQEVVDIKVS